MDETKSSATFRISADDASKKVSSDDLATGSNPFIQSQAFEDGFKSVLRNVVKRLLPALIRYSSSPAISPPCMGGLTKYIGALVSARVWAVRMLDATSKPMSGVLEGTFVDYGSFDECLEISVPIRKDREEFRGRYCAVEARPYMRPLPKNFSLARRNYAQPYDSLSTELLMSGSAFHYFQFRFGICLPSTCLTDDVRSIAKNVGRIVKMNIKVPRCYVREDVRLETIHITVVSVLILLVTLATVGVAVEMKVGKQVSKHCRSKNLQNYFNHLSFEAISNAWLSVESFFFLSGLLVCYGSIQMMEKTKGRIHVPYFILRRYMRLTPTFLLIMGLFLCLPLVSSGPFWYENMDQEMASCRTHWWTNLLYISNWFSMNNICIHPTWYFSADFQLHVLSLLILYPLYRSNVIGHLVVSMAICAGFLTVALITYVLELPPIILISSGNHKQITDTIDMIHMRTYTHIGPYSVGIMTGYAILKYKDVKLTKFVCLLLWCASSTVSVASLYGVHSWSVGLSHSSLVTSFYATLHRITFVAGIAWIAFACVSGHAGPINSFLSSPFFVPLSRLTYATYLLHILVIWTRRASGRERFYYSHYTLLYEWVANWVISVVLAIPLNLLVEAPLANLDKLIFTKLGNEANARKITKSGDSSITSSPSNHIPDPVIELKSFRGNHATGYRQPVCPH